MMAKTPEDRRIARRRINPPDEEAETAAIYQEAEAIREARLNRSGKPPAERIVPVEIRAFVRAGRCGGCKTLVYEEI